MVFQLMLTAWLVADLAWWREADRKLRRAAAGAGPRGRRWSVAGRVAVGVLGAAVSLYMLVLLVGVLAGHVPDVFPLPWHAAAYVWHFLVLPVVFVSWVLGPVTRWAWRRASRRAAHPPTELDVVADDPAPTDARPTRREALWLAAGAVAPSVLTTAITARALAGLSGFRVREVELTVPGLPPDLDGLTIAHLSDLHVGKFLPAGMLGRVADATNALGADLVAFTGDLIDIGDLRRLPAGLDFLGRLDRRHGMAVVEGNHDVMIRADEFEADVRSAGLPLLLDESLVCRVPGRATPVQLLGLAWGEWKTGAELERTDPEELTRRFRVPSDAAREASVRRVHALRDAGAFPILLAHHPHAFDVAADLGFPLTLAGHTHGGQLMLTDRVGVGPMRFRYWTGWYARGASRLFVSNGIGNWFPLRLNAPPEVVRLTLRSQ